MKKAGVVCDPLLRGKDHSKILCYTAKHQVLIHPDGSGPHMTDQ